MNDDELLHYGVKGMKWGIRRTPAQLGHTTKKAGEAVSSAAKAVGSAAKKAASAVSSARAASKQKKEAKQEEERQKKLRKKKVSEMTDDELKEQIARLELEKRYRDLTPQDTKRGESWVTRALKSAGESSVKNLAEQTFDTLGGESINRIAAALTGMDNPNDPASRIVNPRKRQSAKK